MPPACTYRNINSYVNQAEDLFFFFCSSALNVREKKDMCDRVDLFLFFFALHRFSVLKIGHRRTCRPFFALPINAALGFKIFSNAALRVNIISHPCCG